MGCISFFLFFNTPPVIMMMMMMMMYCILYIGKRERETVKKRMDLLSMCSSRCVCMYVCTCACVFVCKEERSDEFHGCCYRKQKKQKYIRALCCLID
mmetsp:Transcript_21269/g.32559  ORF Transcript_21269/g.32559 Transcript_21269/m.32559 type:complete len:97 (-) Transcript_21269:118-408(-)